MRGTDNPDPITVSTRAWLIAGLCGGLVLQGAAMHLAVFFDGFMGTGYTNNQKWPLTFSMVAIGLFWVAANWKTGVIAGLATGFFAALAAYLYAYFIADDVLIQWSVAASVGMVALNMSIVLALNAAFRRFHRGLCIVGATTVIAALIVLLSSTLGPRLLSAPLIGSLILAPFLLSIYAIALCLWRIETID